MYEGRRSVCLLGEISFGAVSRYVNLSKPRRLSFEGDLLQIF